MEAVRKFLYWWGNYLAIRGTGFGDFIQKEEGQLDIAAANSEAESMARMVQLQGPNQQHVEG